jgi:mannosyltransferase
MGSDSPSVETSSSRAKLAHALELTVVAAIVFGIAVNRPSPWRDEVATLASSRVSLLAIYRDAHIVDAVHASYYVLVHLIGRGSDDILAGRWISVVCLALTVGLVSLIGANLGSSRTGVLAGIFLIVSPLASRYAEEARPFALAALASTAATLSLLVATSGRRSRVWWIAYGLLIVATGVADVLALSVLLAHLAYILTLGDRRVSGRWTGYTVVALAVLSPFLRVVLRQRGQVGALHQPRLSALLSYFEGATSSLAGLIAAAVLALGAVALAVRSQATPGTPSLVESPATALALAVTWGLAIPVALFLGSQLDPLFAARYLVFCIPGIALALGLAAARIPLAVAVIFVVVIGATGLPHQVDERKPGGHGENLVALDAIVRAEARPGAEVVFAPWSVRRVTQLEPELWRTLRNPVLEEPDQSTALFAARAGSETAIARLSQSSEVILISKSSAGGSQLDSEDRSVTAAVRHDLTARRTLAVEGFTVEIFTR